MSLLLDSYRRNAAAAHRDAERAILPNVRARAVKAAETWADLAERLERVEAMGRDRAGNVEPAGKWWHLQR